MAEAAEGWPLDSDGNRLKLFCDVVIHSVPEDSVKSMLNGQEGQCARYDAMVNRVFVKIKVETLAFHPGQLRKVKEASGEIKHEVDAKRKEFPRGSGGAVLYPGTVVRVHGLRGKRIKLNGKEGTCEYWDCDKQLMDVRLRHHEGVQTISNKNLCKVHMAEPDALGAEGSKILRIFQNYDIDGDGTLDMVEFDEMLTSLGLEKLGGFFLKAIDKDGDNRIKYEEFLEWSLSPVAGGTQRKNLDMYWPEKRSSIVTADQAQQDERAGEGDSEDDHESGELTVRDVLKVCHGTLPKGWPKHGLALVNNMRVRFPEYPLEGIITMMVFHDFIGGRVLQAIRETGAAENDATETGAMLLPAEYPLTYEVQLTEGLPVFDGNDREWSFSNMRLRRIGPVGSLSYGERFRVTEVRKGYDYGFCFGLIEHYKGDGRRYWADMGLLVSGGPKRGSLDALSKHKPPARRASGATGEGPQCSDARCV